MLPRMNSSLSENELALVSILNGMYTDNLTQITQMTASINTLTSVNSHIRELLVQILHDSNIRPNIRPNIRSNRHNNHTNTNTRQARGHESTYMNYLTGLYDHNESLDSFYLRPTRASYDNRNIHSYHFPINYTNERNTALSHAPSHAPSNAPPGFFDPIPVFPTQTQIERATRRARFSDIVSPRNIACPISMVDFTDTDVVSVIRHCGHIFATDQLNIWFESHCTCPVCRFDIRISSDTPDSVRAVDPSGNNPTTSNNTHTTTLPHQVAATHRIPNTTSLTNTINNFANSLSFVDTVTRIFADASGNYSTSDSDPLAIFDLIYQVNNTHSRNSR